MGVRCETRTSYRMSNVKVNYNAQIKIKIRRSVSSFI